MKTFDTDKTYSWLQWPVALKSCKEPSLHLTLKFFGHAELSVAAIEEILMGQLNIESVDVEWLRQRIMWSPEIFGELVHVLEIKQPYPGFIRRIHNAFALIKDQFEPWRPHISVPLAYWERVRDEKLTPVSEELMFGATELYLGKGD